MYEIVKLDQGYGVSHNGKLIIASATGKPLLFVTKAAARAFIATMQAADKRHGDM